MATRHAPQPLPAPLPAADDTSELENFVLRANAGNVCRGCATQLLATSAVAILHGLCPSCHATSIATITAEQARATQAAAVRLVDAYARVAHLAPPPPVSTLVWDRSGNVVTALYDGERANYRVDFGQLVEANGRLPDEAFAELEHDVFGHQHYRGDVPRVVARSVERPCDGAPRTEALEALGLGVCAKCEDLACDCACGRAAKAVSR